MHIVRTLLIVAAASLSLTAIGLFAAREAQSDHTAHLIVGGPGDSPLSATDYCQSASKFDPLSASKIDPL